MITESPWNGDGPSPLRLVPLGGLGEIGLNMMVIVWGDDIIVVDAGLMFPDATMFGIDLVIPDVGWLVEQREKVRGIFLTHGHEDHVGALPYILPHLPVPLYGTALTLGFVREKLKEFNLDGSTDFTVVTPLHPYPVGPFTVEYLRVTHSIVDGCGLAIRTPVGTIIHTGDFKIDHTPVDGVLTDLHAFARYGNEGVLLLLADSTNVKREGYTISESTVGAAFNEIFPRSKGRIIVACFSSNIHRVKQAADAAVACGRKVLLNGRSMEANVRIARELGYIDIPTSCLIDLKEAQKLPRDKVCIISTGSQGEPRSALSRIAIGDHKQIVLEEGDTVILSSRFIPGNEKTISELINNLYRRGAEVYHEQVSEVHVSGHASQEELKLMMNLVRPRFFIPVHGEYRHLVRHRQLAREVGITFDRSVLAVNGDVVEVTPGKIGIVGRIDAGRVFVDGKGVGDVGEIVLKDRKHLSEDGMVVVIVGIDQTTGSVIYGPDISSRGFVFEDESREFLDAAKRVVGECLDLLTPEVRGNHDELKQEVRQTLRRFFRRSIERHPVILPIIMEM
ncbi:MAG: ribonuclease J [Desulfuromonadia bacterium]